MSRFVFKAGSNCSKYYDLSGSIDFLFAWYDYELLLLLFFLGGGVVCLFLLCFVFLKFVQCVLLTFVLRVPGPISHNGFFIQMMRHHSRNLGFKFKLNR